MVADTFTTSDGVTIAFSLRGTGPRLYVCHGGPLGTYEALAGQLRPLEDELTLVFHDYRGSGASAAGAPRTYDFSHLADDLDQLRAFLGDQEIDVLAHSMGVAVALHYASRHRTSLRRLVLVGGTPLSAKLMPWAMMRALGPVRLAKTLMRGIVFVLWWSWRRGSAGRNQALLRLSRATGESRPELRRATPDIPLQDNDNTRRLQHRFLRVDVTDELGAIDRPTLVLYGDQDAVAVAGARRFRRLPNVEFEVLTRIGHEIFADAPELALSCIRAFITEQHP
jgi:pimeloyl-ACP methyl ester carboxylesterase